MNFYSWWLLLHWYYWWVKNVSPDAWSKAPPFPKVCQSPSWTYGDTVDGILGQCVIFVHGKQILHSDLDACLSLWHQTCVSFDADKRAQEDVWWVKLSYASDPFSSLTQVAKLYCLPSRNNQFIETKWTSGQLCFVIKFTMYSMSAMPSEGLQTFAWLEYVTMTELINFKVDCILCWNHARNDRRIAVRL